MQAHCKTPRFGTLSVAIVTRVVLIFGVEIVPVDFVLPVFVTFSNKVLAEWCGATLLIVSRLLWCLSGSCYLSVTPVGWIRNYIICWILRAFLLVLSCDLLEDGRIDDVIISNFLSLYYIKQIDSMLPCVCSVIDHRWRQNVVRTSVTLPPNGSCATFSFLPHFDVICDLLLSRRRNLFFKWC